jgi:hypothetical protein
VRPGKTVRHAGRVTIDPDLGHHGDADAFLATLHDILKEGL